jgi:diguanylate cyclase (GGDEF)-like protein/PAS domain S-box-containing protein
MSSSFAERDAMTTTVVELPSVAAPAAVPARPGKARLPYVVFAVGAAAITGFLLAPHGSALRVLSWSVPFVLAAVLLTVRVRSAPAGARRPLQLLLAGQLLYLGGSLVWYVAPVWFGYVLPFPSPLDLVFFVAYGLYAGFLLLALSRRARGSSFGGRLALADAGILTTAMSAVLFVTAVEPHLVSGATPLATAVAVAYPGFQLVLFALAAHLAVAAGRAEGGVAALLFLWIAGELVGDVFYGFQSANGTFDYGGVLLATWMLSYTALAALATHPGLTSFLSTAPASSGDRGVPSRAGKRRPGRRLRSALLLLAALVPLGLAGVRDGLLDLPMLTAAAVTFTLALYRASLLAGDLAEQRRLGELLEDALGRLRASHHELARLAAAVDAARDAVIVCSADHLVLDWNSGAERLYGYTREEAVGRPIQAVVAHERRLLAAAPAAGGTEHDHFEAVVVRQDGTAVEVEVTLSNLHDENGEVLAVVGISRDVTERNALHREVAGRSRRLDEAQRVAGIGSWDWDVVTDDVVWSAELRRIVGVAEDVTVSLRLFLDNLHPDDRPEVERRLAGIGTEQSLEHEARIVRSDGELRSVAVRGQRHVDAATGALVRVSGTVQDVTERLLLQAELSEKVRRLDEAQRLAGVGSFEQDLRTGVDVWSSEYYRILGAEQGTEASYAGYLDRVHPEDRHRVHEYVTDHDPQRPLEYEARIVRPDGEVRWIAVSSEIVTDSHGTPLRRTGTAHDVTDRKAAESELERLAFTDSLTGLANRDRFMQLLEGALESAGERSDVALLLLDLDGFKDVNDGIGHDAGDLVLQEVARRITPVLRGDELARLGGDEFAVVLPGCHRIEDAIGVASKIRSSLEHPFDVGGITVHVGASVGMVLSGDGITAGDLLKKADVAMYRAKKLGSGWAVFEPQEDDLAAGRLAMVADLRASIEHGALDVAYQPILDVRTRGVSSFEALARWHHPQRGVIPPDQFIPLAEQADLIVPLTRLVLSKAAAACAAWRSAGHDLRIGVNLSVQVLETGDAYCMVAEALASAGLDPQHVVLEITESALATQSEQVDVGMRALRELGVTLVIDDFGTGYSAMSYLKELPVAELKIDRSFVRDIASDSRDLAIVRSLIRLAHSLSLRVVAEGVESAPALAVLTGLGCDFAQGYGIARPMCEADTAGWLARYDPRSSPGTSRAEPDEVLIVDDSATLRAHLSSLARDAGWRVREAASGEEAIAQVERSFPDVVVLDHHMGGITGMESVPKLRGLGFDGPILLFTGFLSEAIPSMRVPLDVWPVSKTNPESVFELLGQYRASTALAVS